MSSPRQPIPESTQAEAAAKTVWRKMRMVTRIISICAVLIVFDVGKALWPNWLVTYQLQAFLIILLALILSILITPRLVAAAARSHIFPP